MGSSFRRTVPVLRPGATSFVDGYHVQGADTTFDIQASVQPLTPSEVEDLPEGRRNNKHYWLFTETDLNMVGATNPDKVTLYGSTYELYRQGVWKNNVIEHNRYLVGELLEQ